MYLKIVEDKIKSDQAKNKFNNNKKPNPDSCV